MDNNYAIKLTSDIRIADRSKLFSATEQYLTRPVELTFDAETIWGADDFKNGIVEVLVYDVCFAGGSNNTGELVKIRGRATCSDVTGIKDGDEIAIKYDLLIGVGCVIFTANQNDGKTTFKNLQDKITSLGTNSEAPSAGGTIVPFADYNPD